MKISFVSSSYPRDASEWQSVFIAQMLTALSSHSNDIINLWSPPGEFPKNINYYCSEKESTWLQEVMEEGGVAFKLRNNPITGYYTAFKMLHFQSKFYTKSKLNTDIYHVNWLQNALSLPKNNIPLLITVLGSDLKYIKLIGIKTRLRYVFAHRKCIIAPNAMWMKEELETVFGDIATIIPIPFGLNKELYKVKRIDNYSKRKWFVILRITQKKIGQLFNWGSEYFNQHSDELHLIGPIQDNVTIPEWVHYHGATNPNELQTKWFPQATGIISLSEHDEGRPQILLEAMACAIPVITSNIPAHESLIQHNKTGLTCGTKKEFINSLKLLSNPTYNNEIGKKGRQWVKENIGTWRDAAKRYRFAYEELLTKK